jgi:hypothetical protein
MNKREPEQMSMRLPIIVLAATLAAFPAAADDQMSAITTYLDTEIRAWSADPRIAAAVADQNAVTAGYTQADIDRLDQTWMAEVGTPGSALVGGVLDHPLSAMLRERIAASDGMLTEVFVMDALGLNVASAAPTSDYWQGDEAKFTETFPQGADAVHISEVEFDESSQTYQVQVSIPVVDAASGAVVGAMTIGIDAGRLF